MAHITINEGLAWLKTLKKRHEELLTLRNDNAHRERRFYGASADKEIVKEPGDLQLSSCCFTWPRIFGLPLQCGFEGSVKFQRPTAASVAVAGAGGGGAAIERAGAAGLCAGAGFGIRSFSSSSALANSSSLESRPASTSARIDRCAWYSRFSMPALL